MLSAHFSGEESQGKYCSSGNQETEKEKNEEVKQREPKGFLYEFRTFHDFIAFSFFKIMLFTTFMGSIFLEKWPERNKEKEEDTFMVLLPGTKFSSY